MKERRDSRSGESGFSLVELMVITVIIGIILSFSFVSLQNGMPGHQLRAASSKMASELRLARQKAVAQNNNFTVTFDTAEDSYRVWDDDGSDGYRSSGEEVRILNLPEGIGLGIINIGASNSVTFRPNGSTDKGGFVEIRNAANMGRRIVIVKATASVKEERVD